MYVNKVNSLHFTVAGRSYFCSRFYYISLLPVIIVIIDYYSHYVLLHYFIIFSDVLLLEFVIFNMNDNFLKYDTIQFLKYLLVL